MFSIEYAENTNCNFLKTDEGTWYDRILKRPSSLRSRNQSESDELSPLEEPSEEEDE